MEDLLKKINDFLLSISPDIYLYIIGGIIGGIVWLILLISAIKVIYDLFKKAGEKFDTTPLGAFFIILTLLITPIRILYTFLKLYLRGLLFFIIGLFKIIIGVVGAIIQRGKGNTSNLEMKALTLVGAIKTLEDELAESKAKRKELLDSIATSLGGSFNISDLHSVLIILLHTMSEHQGFDRELLASHAVKSTLEASAGRIHDLLMNDLSPNKEKSYDEFDDDIPF